MTASTARVKLSRDGRLFEVSGNLSFITVPRVRDLGNELLQQAAKESVFDFKDVSRSDSAALSLLTGWSRQARQLDKSVRFINLPQQLMDIARLSSLDKVLSLAPLSVS